MIMETAPILDVANSDNVGRSAPHKGIVVQLRNLPTSMAQTYKQITHAAPAQQSRIRVLED
jgi:hypothetical protein